MSAVLPLALIGSVAPGATAMPAPATSPLASPVWLCRPGLAANPCNQNQSGDPQTVHPDGRFRMSYPNGLTETLDATHANTVEPFAPPKSSTVDCFYAYPTVDQVPNPNPRVGSVPPVVMEQHMAVTLEQVARFTGACRMFVPLYRQASLSELFKPGTDMATGLGDVVQAWQYYWDNYNTDPATGKRRGVVLIGHSQGSIDLTKMMQQHIDTKPDVRAHLVSAIVPGGIVQVPLDKPAGGGADPASTFQYIPVCERQTPATPMPTGCVVHYSSYNPPNGQPPGPRSMFSRSTAAGHKIACVNPAALVKGNPWDGKENLDMYLPTKQLLNGTAQNPAGTLRPSLGDYRLPTDPTGFKRVTGEVQGQCRYQQDASGSASWVQVTGGTTWFPASAPTSSSGLHMVDFGLQQGDLVNLVRAQSLTWLRQQ
nr:hypothetical protein [Kibdelosporangium sp. MJ126-NF4]